MEPGKSPPTNVSSDSESGTPDVDNDTYAVVNEKQAPKAPEQEVNRLHLYMIDR